MKTQENRMEVVVYFFRINVKIEHNTNELYIILDSKEYNQKSKIFIVHVYLIKMETFLICVFFFLFYFPISYSSNAQKLYILFVYFNNTYFENK